MLHFRCKFYANFTFINIYAIDMLVRYITRAAAIAADVLVLGATWSKTFHQWHQAQRLEVSSPLITCLLRDGK